MAYQGAVLDMDGTLVRGESPIPGAAEAVARLRDAGLELLLFSNNPTKRGDHYRDRLAAHGIDFPADRVLTSGTVTADYLAAEHPDDDLFVVGESGLLELLRERDLSVCPDPADADAVVASIDREFDYDRLTDALWALERDVPFFGTDPDRTIPAESRLVPGSGAIINAVAGVAERDPDAILGKPSETAVAAATDRLDAAPESCLVVGDRLDTDLALGERAGMTTVLVLSGVTTRADVEASDLQPDYVLDSIADIGTVLGSD